MKTIICLYTHGGGIRGLIPALLMQHIEEKTGLSMVDMVDVFSGPSTGAILNTAMNIPHPHQKGRPKYKARHLVRFYEREGQRIFPQDAFRSFRGFVHDFNNRLTKIKKLDGIMSKGHYDPANLGRALRALYGKTTLADSLNDIIIPVYNIATPAPIKDRGETPELTLGAHAVWLKKMSFRKSQQGEVCADVPLFDAVMGSTAAPTYFPCHEFTAKMDRDLENKKITAIDGSVFDNPAVSYMSVLDRYLPQKTKVIMVVLGTGMTQISFTKNQWNKFGALGVVDPAHGSPLINIFFHATESALSSTFEEKTHDNLYIFNKSLVPTTKKHSLPSQDIDDARPENIKRLKDFTNEIIKEQADQLDELCTLLVKHHKTKNKKKFT
jgi:predicted acylesterase/phospholipase RssA